MTTTTHTPLPRPRSGRVAAGASTNQPRISATRERVEKTEGQLELGWWALTVLGLVFLVAAGALSAPSLVLAVMALVAWGMLDTGEASA